MQKRWLLFDMSSVLWQNLLAGKDKEGGREVPDPKKEGRTVWVNSADFGYENFVANFVSLMKKLSGAPRDVVMVFEGQSSKLLRQQILPEYKAGRDRPDASYEEFEKLRERVKETLLGLGALAVWQDGIEADDVLGYLAQNLRSKRTVVSNDGDLLVLVGPDTDVYRTGSDELNVNKYGPFPHRFITLYKALVGDPSDNIKGAHKFGEKSFIEMYATFDDYGMEQLEGLIKTRQLERLAEDVADCKVLQRIIDSKESVYQSWDVARLYPERVNVMRKPLQVKAGMVVQWDPAKHDARLKHWYGASRLVHAGNYTEAAAWAMEKLLASPEVALDIETSTPPESDEWLEAKKRNSGGEEGARLGVDVFGSKLTGYSLTFGDNCQYSLYFTVDHVETAAVKNISAEDARRFMELVPDSKPIVVQNASFELTVLAQEWGEAWKSNGWHGFVPNVYDTKLMMSYVDENRKHGLKQMSQDILGYQQVTYDEVTKGRKMNEMTAEETVAYGNDDTICTVALFNYERFWMELEDALRVYEEVDRMPTYLNALRFVQGTPISLERMFELEKDDDAAHAKAWAELRDFLVTAGWEGTVCPQFTGKSDFTPAAIKAAYQICTGEELKTMVRTPEKLFKLVAAQDVAGAGLLGTLLTSAHETGDVGRLNELLKMHFSGEPEFKADSPKQMQHLLYGVLGLPVRLRNKPTDAMRKAGVTEGSPRTDDYALQFALTFDQDKGEETLRVLKHIQTMKIVETRRKLYYVPYRNVRHWRDNLVHSQVNQNATVTRRYSEADPNKQQLPKHAKHGQPARFREVFIPHHKRAVVVSMDFTGQELRNIAEQSQDPNMLACFVGDDKKDMHSLTGAGIWKRKKPDQLAAMIGKTLDQIGSGSARWLGMTYEEFNRANDDPGHPDHKLVKLVRALGKKTNFTTEYGAQAPKLAETLIVTEEEAREYIAAKYEQFARAEAWKREVTRDVHRTGYATTMLGARRHLREGLLSTNKFDVAKAERQAVNYKIQGSCAEQTKLAEARLWTSGIFFRYDARYIGPIHDECVFSVGVDDLLPFIAEAHKLMTMGYAGMQVPIISSISFGPSFGEQIEVGEEVNPEAITKALEGLGFRICAETPAGGGDE